MAMSFSDDLTVIWTCFARASCESTDVEKTSTRRRHFDAFGVRSFAKSNLWRACRSVRRHFNLIWRRCWIYGRGDLESGNSDVHSDIAFSLSISVLHRTHSQRWQRWRQSLLKARSNELTSVKLWDDCTTQSSHTWAFKSTHVSTFRGVGIYSIYSNLQSSIQIYSLPLSVQVPKKCAPIFRATVVC